VTTYEDVTVTDVLACPGGACGATKGDKGEGLTVTEVTYSVETETIEEEVPTVSSWSLEERASQETFTKNVIAKMPQEITEVVHVVVDSCGKEGGAACEQTVPTSKIVSFEQRTETVTVTEKKAKLTTHEQKEVVQGTPSYRTEYQNELHETASLMVETVPMSITETVIKTKTETVTEDVAPVTKLHTVTETAQGCPDGAATTEKGCVKTLTVAKKVECPRGSVLKNGVCVEKTTKTVSVCPPGSQEGGKGGCETTESIPATANYGVEGKDTPQQTKKAAIPAAQKKNFRL